MDKWSCLRVIIDFVFDLQQPKPGLVSFCTDAISKILSNLPYIVQTELALFWFHDYGFKVLRSSINTVP